MITNTPRPWYFSTRARVIAALLVCVVLVGRIIYQNTTTSVSVPDKLILYSLEFHEDYIQKGIPDAEEKFRGIPVLGKVEITDPAKRKEIIDALNISKAEGKLTATCFYPRHGLRVVEGGREIDHLICFECQYLQIHLNGVLKPKAVPISRHAQSVFNKFLDEAQIPIMAEARDKVEEGN